MNKSKITDLSEEHARSYLQDIFLSNAYRLKNELNLHLENSVTLSLFEIKTGGSEGGDCWGGHTSPFSVNSEDQKDELIEDIRYEFIKKVNTLVNHKYDEDRFDKILEKIAIENKYNSVTTFSSYGDYYGNGSDYDVIGIPILDTLRKILDYTDYCTIESVFEEEKNNRLNELNSNKNKEDLEKVNKTINNFENNQAASLVKLKKELEDAQKRVTIIENKLSNFEKNQNKELKNLKKEKEDLESKVGQVNSSKLKN